MKKGAFILALIACLVWEPGSARAQALNCTDTSRPLDLECFCVVWNELEPTATPYNYYSLRNKVSLFNASAGCPVMPGLDAGQVAQGIYFMTPSPYWDGWALDANGNEVATGVNYYVNHVDSAIPLAAPLSLTNGQSLVIGNWPTTHGPEWLPVARRDYGNVTIDARAPSFANAANFADKLPFRCDGASRVVLRNLTIRTAGIPRSQLFDNSIPNSPTSCLKDGGANTVCYANVNGVEQCDDQGPNPPPQTNEAGVDNDGDCFCEGIRDPNAPINMPSTGIGTTASGLSSSGRRIYARRLPIFQVMSNLICTRSVSPACTQVLPNDCNDNPDDNGAAFFPGQTETCDEKDNNCNLIIDNDVAPGADGTHTYFRDSDGDTSGVTGDAIVTCSAMPPPGFAKDDGDCNDNNRPDINPKVIPCDFTAEDKDCDGTPDNQPPFSDRCADDADQDGDNWTVREGDCADADVEGNKEIHPEAAEVCGDTINNDCDLPEVTPDKPTWYADTDKDGYGDPDGETELACPVDDKGPEGFVLITEDKPADCDDSKNSRNPGLTEKCDDTIDNDCDNIIDSADDDCANQIDDDGDGWPRGTGSEFDCDDGNPNVNPSIIDLCDDTDNDCNPLNNDDRCEGERGVDDDKDGFSEDQGDCDDGSTGIHPDFSEICGDKLDNDCDGRVDEAVTGNVVDVDGCIDLDDVVDPTQGNGLSTGGCSCDMGGRNPKAPRLPELLLGMLLAPITLIGGMRLLKRMDSID